MQPLLRLSNYCVAEMDSTYHYCQEQSTDDIHARYSIRLGCAIAEGKQMGQVSLNRFRGTYSPDVAELAKVLLN